MNILLLHNVKLLNIPASIGSQANANRPIFVDMAEDAAYMRRCLDLAERGLGSTAPNPLVGAVLVFEDRIIGEGYHALFGGPHAEVNCIASVKEQDRPLISRSKLFVSLEPCSHHGKTPPCTDLILHHKIPEVIIAMKDPFAAVNGKGIQLLSEAGILVRTGILEKEARYLNRRFITLQEKKRPYVILKWAQTANHKLAGNHSQRLRISGPVSDRLVHRWRSEESAIMIGKNTALTDDPLLTKRYWSGPSPIRIVMDTQLQLPGHLLLFRDHPTWILNEKKEGTEGSNTYIRYSVSGNRLEASLKMLGERNLMSILVEGGPTLLNAFLQEDHWDEIRTITNTAMTAVSECHAPVLKDISPAKTLRLGTDTIQWYYRQQN